MQWWEEKAYAREEGWEEGHEKGIAAGELRTFVQLVCRKLSKELEPDLIADILETDIVQIQRIIDAAAVFSPDYDVDKITQNILKQS